MRKISHLLSLSLLITLYGADWCGWCHQQKIALDSLSIPYKYVDSSSRPAEFDGIDSIPFMVNDKGQIHVGYLDGDALMKFVGEA